ncbi:lipase 3-like [Lutzomyia longipalpis]|uniref:lipase 3-like n=1 Tax=Lutzomyia longipalpis TaxID=7200 RepID=UPI002483FE74|nr:lipase 3-like [Lutzomyia longipalpis]
MVRRNGYPLESHEVQTPDGYLLTVHRISHGKMGRIPGKSRKRVAFLQHGFLSSSADWIGLGPQRALAYLLADRGFDVWMGNARGNKFSRCHVTKNPKESSFWDFSWHEIGVFDVPAMIDYVLRETGQKQLHYVGHSQGTTVLFVMLSLRPEYNRVLLTAHALSPVAFMSHAQSPLVRLVGQFGDLITWSSYILGMREFMYDSTMLRLAGSIACTNTVTIREVCANIVFLIAGYNSPQLDRDSLPVMLQHFPAGASMLQLIHYIQLFKCNCFRQFNYGLMGNMMKYKTPEPPEYPLERITARIYLYYGDNDWLAATKDASDRPVWV